MDFRDPTAVSRFKGASNQVAHKNTLTAILPEAEMALVYSAEHALI